VIRRLLFLVGGCVAFGLLVALPARHLGGGDSAVVFIGTGLLLCLVPMTATLIWGERALRQTADQQMILVLGGTGLRMAFVLLTGGALFQWVPYYREQAAFLIWLVVCYSFTLALDMTLLLMGRPNRESNLHDPRTTIPDPRSTIR
jgi:hypothetical protein